VHVKVTTALHVEPRQGNADFNS